MLLAPLAPVPSRRTTRRPDRVLFPVTGFTKNDALRYYEEIAPVLLPHLRDRPLSFKRYPSNVSEEGFWEKDAPSFTPPWVKRVAVPRKDGTTKIDYIVASDIRTLLWIADVGGIELHPFLHTTRDLTKPTSIIFDLDPGTGAGIVECCKVAKSLREKLSELDLECFAKTTGSKGLQVLVPLNTAVTHDATEMFAQVIADDLARVHPDLVTSRMNKALRTRRVFIDWSQNAWFKTNIAVYSLRAKSERPYVSMPLEWMEVLAVSRSGEGRTILFGPDTALKRVARKGDLFAPLLRTKQHLPGEFLDAVSRLPRQCPARNDEADEGGMVVKGIRLPKQKSQSGRRLFVLPKTELGNEIWLDDGGRFRRYILRPDRDTDRGLIAMPAGRFPVDPSYFRGEVQEKYRSSVTIGDIGTWERIDGSFEEQRLSIFFNGHVLQGEWKLRKIDPSPKHRSWSLRPA